MNQRRVRRVGRPNLTPDYERPQAPPQVRRTSFNPRLKWLLTTGAIALLIGLALLVGRINTITVVGATDPAAIASQARGLLKPWTQGYIYWFSSQQLTTNLLESDSASLATADVKMSWLARKITIMVEERHPVIDWQSNHHDYLIDQKGVATAQSLNSDATLPKVIDQTNLDVAIGKPVAPDSFVSFVLDVASKLPKVLKLDYRQGRVLQTTNELFVDTSAGYYIRFDTTRSVGDQLAEVKTLLLHGIKPASYVDVRLAYKAYYK